jgi:hypothetical protein
MLDIVESVSHRREFEMRVTIDEARQDRGVSVIDHRNFRMRGDYLVPWADGCDPFPVDQDRTIRDGTGRYREDVCGGEDLHLLACSIR